MSNACFLSIYIGGMILIPIVFGIWRYDIVRNFEADDYLYICFLLAIWPLVGLFCVGMVLAFGILYLVSLPFKCLMKGGAWLRETMIRRKTRKREKAEREHEERMKNAKPGDSIIEG